MQDSDNGRPGVNAAAAEPNVLYRFFAADDTLLYIGITKDLGKRLRSHNRSKDWFREVAYIRLEHFDSRTEAEQAEILAIRAERPAWNIIYRELDPEDRRELEDITAQITRLNMEADPLRQRARELVIELMRAGESPTVVASRSPYSYGHVRVLGQIASRHRPASGP